MTNLTKQAFIKQIEGMGFELEVLDCYVKGKIEIMFFCRNIVCIEFKKNKQSLSYESVNYNKALKLIKMILAGDL